jgi:hypothetical protein
VTQCCGTCMWFVAPPPPYTNGDCIAAAPACLTYAERSGMEITDGQNCPCYDEKETPDGKE